MNVACWEETNTQIGNSLESALARNAVSSRQATPDLKNVEIRE